MVIMDRFNNKSRNVKKSFLLLFAVVFAVSASIVGEAYSALIRSNNSIFISYSFLERSTYTL